MKFRKVGESGLSVSAISLGGWVTFGGTVDDDTTRDILKTAFDAGINFIDLADVYAGGQAESIAGKALRGTRRSDLVISSKVFWPMSKNVNDRGLSRKHIMESIDRTLTRLGTDYVDIYFCHRADPATPMEETVRAMDDLVHRGKVLYWGTSVWGAPELEAAHAIAERRNLYPPRVEQPCYNLLDRHIEAKVLPTAQRLGMGVVVWSPLAQGMLTGKYNEGVPPGSRAATTNWLKDTLTEENRARTQRFCEVARMMGHPPEQVALAWLLRHPEISAVVTGASTPDQLHRNLGAIDIELHDAVVEKIEEIFPADR